MAVDARPVSGADEALIAEATDVLHEQFEPGRHVVASALRADSGATYAAINLRTRVGNAQVHCEPITVGNAIAAGETGFETTVAVCYEGGDPSGDVRVVSACGVCRELLRDHCPGVDVVFRGEDGPVKAPVEALLPARD